MAHLMDGGKKCLRCEELCQRIARYLDGVDPTFYGHSLGTAVKVKRQTDCSACQFLLRACGRALSFTHNDDSEAVLEIHINDHGCLYIRETADLARKPVYLLPLESSPASISGRRLESLCEPGLIRRWIQSCVEWHGPNCYTPGWSEHITPLAKTKVRLIDVHQRCLVIAPTECRYVALSYVWGDAKLFQTTQSNLSVLQKRNGLDKFLCDIPTTIADAIHLVFMIGERYLWVDSLCIVQDDPIDKHSLIANMDAIYGNAFLTINATLGKDANAGLLGVRPMSRKLEQHLFEYLPGRRIVATKSLLVDVANSSYWNTRAWTYQERFLSKRSLTFTESHASFQCQRMLWCEDVEAEDEKIIDYHQMDDFLPIDWHSRSNAHMYKLHYALHVYKSVNWAEYLRTVEEYTPRMLSFDSDILAAFAGMSKVLGSMFRSCLLYGLPESLFDCALLWQPAGTLTRRHISDSTSNPLAAYFPSWSWAGWKGDIVYEDIMPHLKMLSPDLIRRTKPLVEWQKQTTDGSRCAPISSIAKVGQYILEPFEDNLPHGWSVSSGASFDDLMDTYYYHESNPSSFFAVPSPLTPNVEGTDSNCWTRIFCMASSCMMKIDPEPASVLGSTERFNILNGNGLWHGCVWLDHSWNQRTTDMHEFVAISEGTAPRLEVKLPSSTEEWTPVSGADGLTWYEFFNVMLIERKESIAFRAGLGKVDKARWNCLPTITKNVCLA